MTPNEWCTQIIGWATQEVHKENNISAFSPALMWSEGSNRRKILRLFLWKWSQRQGFRRMLPISQGNWSSQQLSHNGCQKTFKSINWGLLRAWEQGWSKSKLVRKLNPTQPPQEWLQFGVTIYWSDYNKYNHTERTGFNPQHQSTTWLLLVRMTITAWGTFWSSKSIKWWCP